MELESCTDGTAVKEVIELPCRLRLSKEVKIGHNCYAVALHEDIIYVGNGLNGHISRILPDYTVEPSYIKVSGDANGIVIDSRDIIYILSFQRAYWTVFTHQLTTKATLKNWQHYDNCRYTNGLALVGDKIIVPNRQNDILTVYRTSGSLSKTIYCHNLLGDGAVSICSFGDDSVIVSACSTFRVFRVNVLSGERMWIYHHRTHPGGVVPCGPKYIILADLPSDLTSFVVIEGKFGESIH